MEKNSNIIYENTIKNKIIRNHKLKKYEFIILLALTLFTVFLFLNKELDLWAAHLFYHPINDLNDPWFEQNNKLWLFFYYSAPWLTGVFLLGSLILLLMALFKEKLRRFKIHAIFIFLLIMIGPGLFINGIFKPYWGRPRPREVIELGGKHQYLPFYKPAVGSPGKSFPCGHCSVGFSYIVLWWIFRQKKPIFAKAGLCTALGLGLLMGLGRMAAGGHFLSDVVWSGLITIWISYWLYHHALKIPQREERSLALQKEVKSHSEVFPPLKLRTKSLALVAYSGLFVLSLCVLLIASPFHKEFELLPSKTFMNPNMNSNNISNLEIENLQIEIHQAQIELSLDEGTPHAFVLKGSAKGFGFPGNKVLASCEELSEKLEKTEKHKNNVTCKINRKGFFSDYESSVQLILNPKLLKNLNLLIIKGEIFYKNLDSQPHVQLPLSYKIKNI